MLKYLYLCLFNLNLPYKCYWLLFSFFFINSSTKVFKNYFIYLIYVWLWYFNNLLNILYFAHYVCFNYYYLLY